MPIVSPLPPHHVIGKAVQENALLKARIHKLLLRHSKHMEALKDKLKQSTPPATASSTDAAISTSQIKRIDALGEIFVALDSLQSALPVAWQMPMFVVLGAESAGKSSLLERVSMFNIFPRATTMCTRMPIKIQLRRTSAPAMPTLQYSWLETEPGTCLRSALS